MHKYIATVLILGSLVLAVDQPKLTEMDNLKVQKTYLAAVLAQQNKKLADKAFDAAKATYYDTLDQVKKHEGLPANADIRVDEDNNVTVTLPPTKISTKP
jgi:hypothetical protein